MLQRGRVLQECVAVVCLYTQARICKLIKMLWQIDQDALTHPPPFPPKDRGFLRSSLLYRHFMWQVCCIAKCLPIYINVYDIHVNNSHVKCLCSKMPPNRHPRKWQPRTMSIQLDRKKPPPPGGFSIYYVPWSRAVCKRFHDEMRRSHLVVKSLTHGSWSGNIVNRKKTRGGGFLSIKLTFPISTAT